MKTLEAAYHDCYTIIQKHSKTFSKAFSYLPAPKRKAVWAIYSFCRSVDDIVDEGTNSEAEIITFEKEFHLFLQGQFDANKSMWVALQDVFSRYSMNNQAFEDMIVGQKMDLMKNRYKTMEEVEEYSYYVAGTVGLMLLPVLAPDNHKVLMDGGKALGTAMQLTNILRDIGEDIERDRIYLPSDLMEKYQVTEEEIRDGIVTDSFIKLWEVMAERAEELFQIAFTSFELYPLDARLPVKGAAYMYRAILNSVRKNQYDVFTKRSYVSKEEKQNILAQL